MLLMLCMLTFLDYVACINCYLTCVGFELVKSPEVTLCGWRGYKPSMDTIYINSHPRWGNADVEIKDSPGESAGLSKVPSF